VRTFNTSFKSYKNHPSKKNPLSSTHTSGAAAALVTRASVDMFASADMFVSASALSQAVSVVEAPHAEVSACVPSPAISTPLLSPPPWMPSSPLGWSTTNS
jgi:hypothetical protein